MYSIKNVSRSYGVSENSGERQSKTNRNSTDSHEAVATKQKNCRIAFTISLCQRIKPVVHHK